MPPTPTPSAMATWFQSTPPVSGRRCRRASVWTCSFCEFQSTPPVSGRRCLAPAAIRIAKSSFNPRPPFPGGDAGARRNRRIRLRLVSIHAPRFREAMRTKVSKAGASSRVSIHAPRFREAMPHSAAMKTSRSTFQSTPPVSGRRCDWLRGEARINKASFNPRPPFPGGDAKTEDDVDPFTTVSIHAPRFREAMPWSIRSICQMAGLFQSTPPVSGRRCPYESSRKCWRGCFNPRPPFPGGDAEHEDPIYCGDIVSIHAPRFREAMPSTRAAKAATFLFQSTPPVSGRRCTSCSKTTRAMRGFNPRPPFPGGDARPIKRPARPYRSFNPRPPFPGGDAFRGRHDYHHHTCFNPRPPFPGGDAIARRLLICVMPVSIHAPRFREAMPDRLANPPPSVGVSIHAPRFREAMRGSGGVTITTTSFNPRTPFPGGDA